MTQRRLHRIYEFAVQVEQPYQFTTNLGQSLVSSISPIVKKKAGASATESELMEWSKQEIAGYRYLRYIAIKEEIPMNATGKF